MTIAPLGAGRFRVRGGRTPHLVVVGPDAATCDCADFTYRRRPCKHLRHVLELLVRAPFMPSTAAGPGLDHGVPPPDPAA